jgi:hypothetical protein
LPRFASSVLANFLLACRCCGVCTCGFPSVVLFVPHFL